MAYTRDLAGENACMGKKLLHEVLEHPKYWGRIIFVLKFFPWIFIFWAIFYVTYPYYFDKDSASASLISSYILKLFFGLGSVHRERGQEVALWWHLHTAKVSRRIKCNCTILYSRILIIFYVFFSYLFSHEKLCTKLSSLPTTSIIHNLSKIYNILVTTIIVYQYCKLRNPSLE